jgi:hypothetical protein
MITADVGSYLFHSQALSQTNTLGQYLHITASAPHVVVRQHPTIACPRVLNAALPWQHTGRVSTARQAPHAQFKADM